MTARISDTMRDLINTRARLEEAEQKIANQRDRITRLDSQARDLRALADRLKEDAQLLDWLDSTERGRSGGFYVWHDGVIACGAAHSGMPIREALRTARKVQQDLAGQPVTPSRRKERR